MTYNMTFTCLFVCFFLFSYFLTVSFVFRESPRTVMVTAAGWGFWRTSIPEPSFIRWFDSHVHFLVEVHTRTPRRVLLRNAVSNARILWNAVPQDEHPLALVEPTLSPCFWEGGTDLTVGSAASLDHPSLVAHSCHSPESAY